MWTTTARFWPRWPIGSAIRVIQPIPLQLLTEATAAVNRKTYDLVPGRHPPGHTKTVSICWLIAEKTTRPRGNHDHRLRHGGNCRGSSSSRGFRFPHQAAYRRRTDDGHRTGLEPEKSHRGKQDPQGPTRYPLRHGKYRRPRSPHDKSLRRDRRRGRHPRHRAHNRRKRDGQIAHRPRYSPP